MKSSSISVRVADFLEQHAPFDAISEQDLIDLAMGGRVKFHECDEIIFRQGAQPGRYLFVIQQGTVQLLNRSGDSDLLQDILGEGDLLGIDRLLGENAYRCSARTSSDVILYALPIETFQALTTRYPVVARYLAASSSVRREQSPIGEAASTDRHALIDPATPNPNWLMGELPFAKALHQRLLACSASTPIREVAKRMSERSRDAAAVVDRLGTLKGIISIDTLRDRVATGEVSPQAPAETIMSPICTFAPPGKTSADYLLQLINSGKRYVGITQDGGDDAPLIGLLSETDLTLHTGFNPVTILQEVTQAECIEELARLRSILTSTAAARSTHGPTMEWYSQVRSEFERLLMIQVIRLARTELAAARDCFPEILHCWLFFGAAGRKELSIRKRLDWGVVYADPKTGDEDSISEAFVALGTRIEAMLHACGYPEHGTQPGICHSLSCWKECFRRWIHDPIMSRTYRSLGTFDWLPIDGDVSLAVELKQAIKAELKNDAANFVPIMANDAMAHLPPLTFFHGQVIDDHGEPRSRFDLRHSTLQPLVDMARVFALEEGWIGGKSTAERLEQCAASRPEHQALFKEAAEAFRVALRLYVSTANAERGDDRTIDPGDLGRYEQQLFKSIFRSILTLLRYSADHFGLIPRR
jgi:CBS domain-containing protein